MIIKTATFVKSSGKWQECPEPNMPEYAFIGRSNVGKSSLINAMMNHKDLAKTSGTPGKTQLINHFLVNENWYLTDLPGYGYAKVSESVKEKWGKMVEKYFKMSKQLKMVFLLVDIRHAPSENDRIMYDWIVYHGYQPVIIATKLDKIKRSQKDKQIKNIKESLKVQPDTIIIPFSSETKQGREETWEIIEQICNLEAPEDTIQ